MQKQLLTQTKIRGEISRVRFEKPQTGFAILTVTLDDGEKTTVCGNLSGLCEGSTVEFEGYFEKNDYGLQFRATTFRPVLPELEEGIIRYLTTQVHGIGPKTAKQIVQAFGSRTVNILDNYPGRLRELPGIGKRKAETIISGWKEGTARRDSMIFLQGLGISPAYCSKLFREYSDKAPEIVKSNPFKLAEEIDGIGFLKADTIAKSLGFAEDSPERIAAATVYCLNQAISNGHCGLPQDELIRRTAELIKLPTALLEQGIETAILRCYAVRRDDFIYTPRLAHAEEELPGLLKSVMQEKIHPGRKLTTPAGKFQWAECQKKAVDEVSRSALSIITGGPGVGKTTVIREIVSRARLANLNIALTSPTGRAAKRMTEATGFEAKTIHRLLMYDPVSNGFIYGRDNHLECDILIADECSMLDMNIAYSLFQAIAPGTTVVLVGDADQLPPVGPGKFFSDLIDSGRIPVTRLDQVFRQSAGSRIIEAAHRVNSGKIPLRYDNAESDFFWIRQDDPGKALDMVKKMVTERIPEKFGFDPTSEIQVLTPMNRGNCGAININDMLGECLNPPDEEKQITSGERKVSPGDKVMQTQNNYDKGVYNGDFGIVVNTDVANGKFQVLFDGTRTVEYFSDELDQLTKAYAITVHKSQGSEFPAVILLLLNQHYLMLQRNLIYTAMTRAKKLLVLIGSEKSVEMAVRNTRTEVRHTRFIQNLQKSFR